MKKILFVFSLLFGAAVAVNAQDTTSVQQEPQDTITTQEQSDEYRMDQQDDQDRVSHGAALLVAKSETKRKLSGHEIVSERSAVDSSVPHRR